ncbi:MAG: hypothetical protein ACYC57_05870 [Thermoleophilia bacterium]
MSILLSVYYSEGIVFAADKNVTLTFVDGSSDVEEGSITKVIAWPHRRAVVGYCGLGELAGLPMDEWMRQFVAQTRNFVDLESLVSDLHQMIQSDFNQDYPDGAEISGNQLIVHLGGYRLEGGNHIPAMYLISNVSLDADGRPFNEQGHYYPAERDFRPPSDELRALMEAQGIAIYNARQWLSDSYQAGNYRWFTNGLGFPAFNLFRDQLWNVLMYFKQLSQTPPTLPEHEAFAGMAVELYNSFWRYNARPRARSVGGGVDIVSIAWPEV